MAPTLYLSYEPEHRMIAGRLIDWSLAQPSLDAHDAGHAIRPEDEAASAIRIERQDQIRRAEVLVCLIGQTTFLDAWVNWEIRTYLANPDRRGIVGIMLHDLNSPPPAMVDHGSVFIRFKKDAMEAAVEAAMSATDLTADFVIDE